MQLHSTINKNVKYQVSGPLANCVFTIYPFQDKYMAYCIATSEEKQIFEGNILWGLYSLPLKELIEKINSYTTLQQVKKDFDC